MSAPLITLTSDFGGRDGYVAAMKGVILGICADATLVDVSHELPPYDIPHASFVLGTAFPYFPTDTVHLAIVDPGVGTDRRPILLSTPAGAFVAPDNGLLTYVLIAYGVGIPITADPDGETQASEGMPSEACVPAGCAAYVLDRDRYWLKPTSATFHGRDIFAPVAAHLATGVRPEELGTPVSTVQCLAIPQAVERGDLIEGRIIHVDRFGNLVSNIRLADASPVAVGIAGTQIRGLSHSYHEGGLEILALVGSHGYLEIALREGSAAKHLGADVGTRVEVTLR